MPAIRGKEHESSLEERPTSNTLVTPPRSRSHPSNASASTSSDDGRLHSTSLLDPYEPSTVSRRRKGPGHIPRPPNAFILFRQNLFQQLKSEPVEHDQRLFSQIVSSTWKNLTREQKKPWYDQSDKAKREHEEKYPGYRFMPVVRPDKPRKRNVKRNGPKDRERCHELGLLIAGNCGTAALVHEAKRLDAALRAEGGASKVTRELGIPVSDKYSTAVFDATLNDEHDASTTSVPLPSTPKKSASGVGFPTYAPATKSFYVPQVSPLGHIESFESRLAAAEGSLSTKVESPSMSPALYHMSPLKETPEPAQQPLFIPPSTPPTPSMPLRTMPAAPLAPAITMSELLEGVPGLTEDWTFPFCESFDNGSPSAFSSPVPPSSAFSPPASSSSAFSPPASSSSAFSSPSSSPSTASSAPPTPPQQHLAAGLLPSPAFSSCTPASNYVMQSPAGNFQLAANHFAIPDLEYPGEPMGPGDSIYSDMLALSQMEGMGALIGMQGKGQEQSQDGAAMFDAFFNNGVGNFMG